MIQYKNTLKGLFLGCCFLGASLIALGQDDTQIDLNSIINQDTSELKSGVNMGFVTKEKKDIVGAVSSVRPKAMQKYDNTQWVRDALSGKVLGLNGSDNIRGLGSALIVVDGIPGRDIDLLNMEEIDEITILKDANAAALYGSMAKNGVIIVTTKRGKVGSNKFNISASTGIKVPKQMPKYLNSANYMGLYNEARANDGLPTQYTSELIENTRSGENPYLYSDIDFYSNDYFKEFASFSNVTADFSGGVENTQYYINLGFKNEGELQDISNNDKGVQRFNIRGNIDFKVNDWIKSSIDAVGIIQRDRSSLTNLYSDAASFKPNLYAPLLPISMIDITNNSELAGIVDAANKYDGNILGGSQAYSGTTPFANIVAGGYKTSMLRISQINNSIDFDLSAIAEGLSAKTYVSFDFYNVYDLKIENKYAVYEPSWNADNTMIVGLENVKDTDQKDQVEDVSTNIFTMRYGFYGMLNYEKQITEKQGITASLIGFLNNTIYKEEKQNDRNTHAAFNFNYNYNKRLFVDFSASYINSIKLADGNRGQFAPTLGLAYIAKNSNNKSDKLNYLKFNISGGFIYSDLDMCDDDNLSEYFLYDAVYEQSGNGFGWGDTYSAGMSNKATVIKKGQNNDLNMEKRTDINIGFEALMFNKLCLEGNVFQSTMGDQVIQVSSMYPSYYASFKPYINYNEDRYRGFEFGLNYKDQFGDFKMDVGARLMYMTTERTKVDEVYEDGYQNRKGKPTDAMWGLECLGFFSNNDFNVDGSLKEGIPTHYNAVSSGDLKYKDMNGDNVINDRDMVEIGSWNSPWSFSSDITLSYGDFTLFALLTAEVGGDAMKSGNYYRPQGDIKYSEIALDRWTEETAETAKLPRLTSVGNTNNFSKNSTFWMYDNSYFKIQRIQLTYDIPQRLVDKLKMNDISVFAAGSNLFEFSKNKKIRELSVSWGPNYAYYSMGLRLNF